MIYHLLCLPPIAFMALPELRELLAELETIGDKDSHVYEAIAKIRKAIEARQLGLMNPVDTVTTD